MAESPPRDREIFADALDHPPGPGRMGFLAQACGADPALRARVEALLQAHEAVGNFLADTTPLPAALPAPGESPGDRIGRYRLLEAIGEGGHGIVYLAEQEEPVRRRVALKIIKLGMDTRAVVARFEAERQALALMDHPNIARVFDGGATATGRPYFVMELVRGLPLTTFCTRERLTVRQRLELFMQVCQAVQHAHQKGVIHRDLKPSNILVTLHDERPVPKVIDFGIAKATAESLTDKTLFTRFHQFVGTPAYMSPEQMGLSDLDVDTRSDIYSLGVLLYELLTDRTPFTTRDLLAAGYAEIQRVIREEEPPAPSQRVATLTREEQSVAAQVRRLEPSKLTSQLRGDLDRIAMKCLEKDRTRRYETSVALAQDVARHLNHEPVLARRDSVAYRLRKFTRRHLRSVLAVSAALLALVTFVGVHTARLAAERDRARHEAEKAAQMSELLVGLLSGADPYRTPDVTALTVRGLLDAGAERVRTELANQPELQAEMFTVIGRIYQRLGLHEQAQPLLEGALAAGRRSGEQNGLLAQTLNDLGVLLRERGDLAAAEPLLVEALALRRRLRGPAHNEIAITLVELGRLYDDRGADERAEPLLREALAMRRQVLGDLHRETAVSLGDLGLLLWRKGDLAGAEPLLRESLAIDRQVLGAEHPNTAQALSNLALVVDARGDHAGAETLLREALARHRRIMGARHYLVARALNNLAHPLRQQGKLPEAVAALDEALTIARETVGDEHPFAAMAMVNRARLHVIAGEAGAAEALLRPALGVQERNYAESDWRLAASRSVLGGALAQLGQHAEAETLLLGAHAILKNVPGPQGREADDTRDRLIALYTAWGRPERAAAFRR